MAQFLIHTHTLINTKLQSNKQTLADMGAGESTCIHI